MQLVQNFRFTNVFPTTDTAYQALARFMADDGQADREDGAPERFPGISEVTPEEKDEEACDGEGDRTFNAGGELVCERSGDDRRNGEEYLYC